MGEAPHEGHIEGEAVSAAGRSPISTYFEPPHSIVTAIDPLPSSAGAEDATAVSSKDTSSIQDGRSPSANSLETCSRSSEIPDRNPLPLNLTEVDIRMTRTGTDSMFQLHKMFSDLSSDEVMLFNLSLTIGPIGAAKYAGWYRLRHRPGWLKWLDQNYRCLQSNSSESAILTSDESQTRSRSESLEDSAQPQA